MTHNTPFIQDLRSVALGILLAAVAGATLAQSSPEVRATREREALRRTQQALRSAQDQQAVLEREKASLGEEKSRLDAALKRSAAQAAGAQGQVRVLRDETARLQADVARLQSELEAQRATAAQQQQALMARNDELAQQLVQVRQQLGERTATVSSVSVLLSRSTQALGSAEEKNRELYAIGLKLIDQYRNKTVADALAQREPFLGLREVQLENLAEELRTQIEAHRIVAPVVGAAPAMGSAR